MKLTILMLTVVLMQVSNAAYSQKITIQADKASLSSVLASIRQQSGFQLLYSTEAMDRATTVTVQLKDATLEHALARIFNGQPLTYRLEDKMILVTLKPTIPAILIQPAAREMTVTGTVLSAAGGPIPGASLLERGTGNGTVTDGAGRFSLRVKSDTATLIVRSMGFTTQEVKVAAGDMKIVLKEDQAALSEVVVVGFGTQKKANLTGAVSSVNMDEVLGNRPVSGPAQALQGAVPGLQITYGTGQPGSSTSINIRGMTSINGGSPLVLVDNVPMNIDDVNPKDIENISVLKDAAAASIYGARAAFGVILITTKKGKTNQPLRFNYSNNFTWSNPISLPQKASPMEFVKAMKDFGSVTYWTGQNVDTWLKLMEEYQADPGKYPEGYATVGTLRYPLAETDLYGELFTGGFEQLHNFSFSGGSEKTTYRVAGGYANEDGSLVTSKDSYKRYNFNAYLGTQLARNLQASVNLFYKNDNRSTPSTFNTLFYNAITYSSFHPTGETTLPSGVTLPYNTPNNYVKNEPADEDKRDNLRLFGKLEYEPLKDLKITGEYTFNRTNSNSYDVLERNEYINAATLDRQFLNDASRYYRSYGQQNMHALNLYLNYAKSFDGGHNMKVLLGTNQEISKRDTFSVNRLNLLSAQVPAIGTSTGNIDGMDGFAEYAVSGYFARVNYDYKGKYLLEVNGRYDGSSRFPAGSRFGFFPSVSAGWNVMEEPFMAGLTKALPQLKLRASFGEIGNQDIPNLYPHFPGLDADNSGWINPVTNIRYLTLFPPPLVSSSFTWETIRSLNFGVDAGLFDKRLTFSFDWFRRSTLNMLARSSELPQVLGTSAPLQNVADLVTKGWELEMNWGDVAGDFRYSFGFNLSDNQGEITRFHNPAGLLSNYYEGQKVNEIWGYVTNGYYKVEDFMPGSLNANLQGGTLKGGVPAYRGVPANPGDIRYEDLNGDGQIYFGNNTLSDPGDRRVIGNSTRRFQFGAFGNLAWKQFDLSFFLQGVGKRDLWISHQLYWPYLNQFGTVYKHNLDYWTPSNPEGFYPRVYPDAGGNTGTSRLPQTKYLSNGAYLRVKNITVGYNLPKLWMERLHVSSARIFASAENPFTFDHLPEGMEGDATNYGEGGIYPFMKKFSFGANINF